MTTGKRIQAARKKAGLTQEQFAKLCGVPVGTLRQYEIDRRQPGIKQLTAFSDALGIPLTDLISDKPAAESTDSPYQGRLQSAFDRLNNDGQRIAVERIEELTLISKYQKENENA